MKICMVSDTFWPRINGVSVSVTTLTESLRALGQQVYIVAPDYTQLPGRRNFIAGSDADIDGVIRFPAHGLLFFPEDCSINIVGRDYLKHVQLIRRYNFDIVHTHTPLMLGIMAMYWNYGKRERSRLVHTFHTLFEDFIPCYFPFCYLPGWFSRRFARWFTMNAFHWYCNHFDQVIVPSQQVADLLRAYFVTPPVKVLPTGIRLEQFQNGNGARIRQAWGIGPDEKLLLFAGRVGFEKGIDLILKALPSIIERYEKARLVIVGQGPAESSLKKLIRELYLDPYVTFAGYQPHAEMAHIYAAADLFLLASQTETQGLVTVEAMAAGTPVVAVRGPGTLDLMQNDQGGLLSPPDPAEFANRVVQLLTDPVLYEQKSQQALRRAETMSSLSMARRMLQIYESLL
ncbi:MAG: glycosyltransferase [Anaerolineae bacterium]|nr:glycosyltransferase [Anaerolineae bacterium]